MARTRIQPQQRHRHRDVTVARTREDILRATASLLAANAGPPVSMQRIAAEVGFTAPALYAYFESKEAIFQELSGTLDRELLQTFAAPPAGLGPAARLAWLLRRQLSWADDRRELFLACNVLQMRGELHCASGPTAFAARLSGWLAESFPRVRELGGLGHEQAATLLVGISHAFFLRWLAGGQKDRLADQTDAIVQLFFHGVLGPRTSRST